MRVAMFGTRAWSLLPRGGFRSALGSVLDVTTGGGCAVRKKLT